MAVVVLPWGSWPGYRGLTQQAYELNLRQFASCCQQHQLHLFQARRADIEFSARDLEARGRGPPSPRRLCTVTGFYWCAVVGGNFGIAGRGLVPDNCPFLGEVRVDIAPRTIAIRSRRFKVWGGVVG